MTNNRDSYSSRYPAYSSSSRSRRSRQHSASPTRRDRRDGYRHRSPTRGRVDDRSYSPPRHRYSSPRRRNPSPRRRNPSPRRRNPSPPRRRDVGSRHEERGSGRGPQRQQPSHNSRSDVASGRQNAPAQDRLGLLDRRFNDVAYCLKCNSVSHWQSGCTKEPRAEPLKDFGLSECAWPQPVFEKKRSADAFTVEEMIQHVYQASRRLHSYHNFVSKRNALLVQVVKQSINDPKVDPNLGKEGQSYPSPKVATVFEFFVAKCIRAQNRLFAQCLRQLKNMYNEEIANKIGYTSCDPFDPNKKLTHEDKESEVSQKILNLMYGGADEAWPDHQIEASYQDYVVNVGLAYDEYQSLVAELQQQWDTVTHGLKMWKEPVQDGRQVFNKLPFENLALKMETVADYTLLTMRCPVVEPLAYYVRKQKEADILSTPAPIQPTSLPQSSNEAALREQISKLEIELSELKQNTTQQKEAEGQLSQRTDKLESYTVNNMNMMQQLWGFINSNSQSPFFPAGQRADLAQQTVGPPDFRPQQGSQIPSLGPTGALTHGHPLTGPQSDTTGQGREPGHGTAPTVPTAKQKSAAVPAQDEDMDLNEILDREPLP